MLQWILCKLLLIINIVNIIFLSAWYFARPIASVRLNCGFPFALAIVCYQLVAGVTYIIMRSFSMAIQESYSGRGTASTAQLTVYVSTTGKLCCIYRPLLLSTTVLCLCIETASIHNITSTCKMNEHANFNCSHLVTWSTSCALVPVLLIMPHISSPFVLVRQYDVVNIAIIPGSQYCRCFCQWKKRACNKNWSVVIVSFTLYLFCWHKHKAGHFSD